MKTIFNFFVSLSAFIVAAFTGSAPNFTRRDPCAGANVYSADYAGVYNTAPPVKISAAKLGGRIRIFNATYTQGAADGAIGDVVYFGRLPAGATPIALPGSMYGSAGNAGATLAVGLVGNAACFCAATSIAAASETHLDVFALSGAVLKLAADTDVIGTNAVAAIKAGQVLTLWIPYVLND